MEDIYKLAYEYFIDDMKTSTRYEKYTKDYLKQLFKYSNFNLIKNDEFVNIYIKKAIKNTRKLKLKKLYENR